jgi:hypothetical protein
MGGGKAPANTTTTTELPPWAQPYAQALLQRSAALADQPMPVYTGQRSADMNGYQQAGMNIAANRAMNGSAEIAAGGRNITDTLNGNYLAAGNPYLQQAIDNASQGVIRNYQQGTNNTDAMFARANAFGGSAWGQASKDNANALANQLGQISQGMSYQNYGDERGRQMQALGMAPTYGNQAYMDAQALQQAGQTQYAYDQQKIDDYRDMWTDMAQSPYKQLDVLGSGIRAAVGGGSSVTQSGPSAGRGAGLAQGIGAGAALYGLLN